MVRVKDMQNGRVVRTLICSMTNNPIIIMIKNKMVIDHQIMGIDHRNMKADILAIIQVIQ